MNAAYDNLESTISSLSPKEQISFVPKALLTLNQAIRSVRAPLPPAEQNNPDEDTKTEAQEGTEVEAQPVDYTKLIQIVDKFANQYEAQKMLREGKNFDEITAETGITEEEIKEKIAREKVEHEVLGMYKNGMDMVEIRRRTKLDSAYIDSIINNAFNNRIYGLGSWEKENPEIHGKTRLLLKNSS